MDRFWVDCSGDSLHDRGKYPVTRKKKGDFWLGVFIIGVTASYLSLIVVILVKFLISFFKWFIA